MYLIRIHSTQKTELYELRQNKLTNIAKIKDLKLLCDRVIFVTNIFLEFGNFFLVSREEELNVLWYFSRFYFKIKTWKEERFLYTF